MKITSLESIRNGLVTQLNELDIEFKEKQMQLDELKGTRRQVAAAIKALGGSRLVSEAAKPAPKKKQVQQAIDELLTDNQGQIASDDLETLVAEKLATEQGCSAMGLALRMREVLALDDYLVRNGFVRQIQRKEIPSGTISNTTN